MKFDSGRPAPGPDIMVASITPPLAFLYSRYIHSPNAPEGASSGVTRRGPAKRPGRSGRSAEARAAADARTTNNIAAMTDDDLDTVSPPVCGIIDPYSTSFLLFRERGYNDLGGSSSKRSFMGG